MKLDLSKIYSAVNVSEVKIGSKGYFSNKISNLETYVNNESALETLTSIRKDDASNFKFGSDTAYWAFFYLVEEPEENKYRPYKNADEMLLHKQGIMPWVKTRDGYTLLISAYNDEGVYLPSVGWRTYTDLLNNCTQVDNTPFGVKVEDA